MMRQRTLRCLCLTVAVFAGCRGMQGQLELGQYTMDARKVIFHARNAVDEVGGVEIRPEHLTLGLLAGDVTASKALRRGSVGAPKLKDRLLELLGPQPRPDRHELPLAIDTRRILDTALAEADRQGRKVTSNDILVAVLLEDTPTGRLLRANGLTVDDARRGSSDSDR